jgi:hypothetical protein
MTRHQNKPVITRDQRNSVGDLNKGVNEKGENLQVKRLKPMGIEADQILKSMIEFDLTSSKFENNFEEDFSESMKNPKVE